MTLQYTMKECIALSMLCPIYLTQLKPRPKLLLSTLKRVFNVFILINNTLCDVLSILHAGPGKTQLQYNYIYSQFNWEISLKLKKQTNKCNTNNVLVL